MTEGRNASTRLQPWSGTIAASLHRDGNRRDGVEASADMAFAIEDGQLEGVLAGCERQGRFFRVLGEGDVARIGLNRGARFRGRLVDQQKNLPAAAMAVMSAMVSAAGRDGNRHRPHHDRTIGRSRNRQALMLRLLSGDCPG